MKKILILSIASVFSIGAWANTQYKATAECQFDYDDFNFCSKANIVKYKNALATKKINFDSKFILLNVGSPKYIRYVAIDTAKGIVFPLQDEILGFKDNQGNSINKPPIINFSKNNSYLCIQGSVHAYRDAYDNVNVCYSIQNDNYSKYQRKFTRVDVPKSF